MINLLNSTPAFCINFLTKSIRYRCQKTSLRKELLARALGFHPNEKPYIVDATAGTGRDSLILAALGYEVTLLERSPIVSTLLQKALDSAREETDMAAIVKRLHLIPLDAIDWLVPSNFTKHPDVIYLDPMFPPRKKAAAVKKEMQALQALLNHEPNDSALLFERALACARHRVVVKRPRYAAELAAKIPNFSLKGNHSRFDVYLINNPVLAQDQNV